MTRVIKILQCTNLGGMEKSVLSILPWLTGHGTEFSIATPRPFGASEPFLRPFDLDAVDSEYRGKFGWKTHANFRATVEGKAIDCDHAWITGTDIASLRAVKRLTMPKLFGHHYHHFESRLSFLKWKLFYEVFCRQCDWVTYPSDFVRNEAISIAPWLQARSSVVRQNFPVYENQESQKQSARKALELPPDAFVIGNAGWLIERKRWDIFLSVAEAVLRSLPDAFFVIAGGGELEDDLKHRVRNMDYGDRIRFSGWMEDLEPFYRSLDVLLFNSNFDAFGRTPGEAMGYGVVPVASVVCGGLSELIHDGKNGFISDSHDVAKLASQIIELCNHPELLVEFRQSGEAILSELYSLENEGSFYLNEFSK